MQAARAGTEGPAGGLGSQLGGARKALRGAWVGLPAPRPGGLMEKAAEARFSSRNAHQNFGFFFLPLLKSKSYNL